MAFRHKPLWTLAAARRGAVLCCFLLWLASHAPAPAATLSETNAFTAAYKQLQDAVYDGAERDFADFVRRFPASPRLPEAILRQAEARIKLTNYVGALELLSGHQALAGPLADEYLFWTANAYAMKGDNSAAAEAFGKLGREYPSSPYRLEAMVREAAARAKLGQWLRVIDSLRQTNGVFQAALTNAADPLVVRGQLLLSEAYLTQKAFAPAAAALQPLARLALSPQLDWERQYLWCRILAAEGRLDSALENSTNLLALAAAARNRDLQADSAAFQAEVLERLGRPLDAIEAYQRNLTEGVSPERQRQGLLKITELSLAQTNRLAGAVDTLEKFLQQFPGGTNADLALLTIGELRLRQSELGPGPPVPSGTTNLPPTNYLQLATVALQSFTNRQSPLFGRAQLRLGWCYWRAGNIAQSETAFQTAISRLPVSADQAQAYFKLAEVQFLQTNYSAALGNYSAVLEKFADVPEVKMDLFLPALYKIVQTALLIGDLPVATNALARLQGGYAETPQTARAVLLTAQKIGLRDPAGGRALLLSYGDTVTNIVLLSDIQLAVARTYEQENQWDRAITHYEEWLPRFTNDTAQACLLYYYAQANAQAGRETNALNLLTNFVACFPTNELWPLAQWWVGSYFFRTGHFEDAEGTFQAIFLSTNYPSLDFGYQAMLMAGRCAFARQGWKEARDFYFARLAGNTNCPSELRAQAFFALADTLISQNSTNRPDELAEANAAYDRIPRLCPSNHMTVLAWGGKANCFLQSQKYASASNLFQQIIESPLADVSVRSTAKLGLATALEKMADEPGNTNQVELLRLALRHCLDVFYYEKIIRDGEQPDPFWTCKGGMEAARLAGRLQEHEQELNIYRRLKEMLPPLQLDDKISALRAQR